MRKCSPESSVLWKRPKRSTTNACFSGTTLDGTWGRWWEGGIERIDDIAGQARLDWHIAYRMPMLAGVDMGEYWSYPGLPRRWARAVDVVMPLACCPCSPASATGCHAAAASSCCRARC